MHQQTNDNPPVMPAQCVTCRYRRGKDHTAVCAHRKHQLQQCVVEKGGAGAETGAGTLCHRQQGKQLSLRPEATVGPDHPDVRRGSGIIGWRFGSGPHPSGRHMGPGKNCHVSRMAL